MIGIIGAMKIEIDTIREKTENKKTETIGGIEFVSGLLNGKEIVTAVCGIGKVSAAMCAQIMILRYSPDYIVNTGVAGTLTDALSVGDVAIAENVVQHDMDTTPLGDKPGLISSLGLVQMPCGEQLVKKLTKVAGEIGVKTVKGTIASGDQFICDPAVKERIVSVFGAIACEMEGAAIGQVCCSNSVPFAVVRAISDSADGSAEMSYAEFLPKAAATAARMIEAVVNYT